MIVIAVQFEKTGGVNASGEGVNPNLLKNSSFAKTFTGWSADSLYEIVVKDGYRCAHVNSAALNQTRILSQEVSSALDTSNLNQVYTISGFCRGDNITRGTTNHFVCCTYFGGSWNNSGTNTWMGATGVSGSSMNLIDISNQGWKYFYMVFKIDHVPTTFSYSIYGRDFTGDVYYRNVKLEKGSVATPWIPHVSDSEYNAYMSGFFEEGITPSRIANAGYVQATEFIEW